MLKKGEIIEVTIDEVIFPNKGIANIEENKVIIKNVLKGQKVKARIFKKRRNKIEAKLIEVLERSSIEVDVDCEHYGICGGCSYLSIPYEEQLNMKKEVVLNLLEDANIKDFEFLGIESSPDEFGYRNKMEFTFGDAVKGGELMLGMHQRGKFYEIITVNDCRIADKDFTLVLDEILKYFRAKNVPFYHKMSHKGILRHLVVRKASRTGEMLINLVTSSQGEIDTEELLGKLNNLELEGKLVGFLHTINDNLADTVQSDETRIVFGRDYIIEEILGLKFKISAFSFFQTNSLGAEKLYSIVREFAGETNNKVIFDLYSGTGTIGQIMAPVAKKVRGIEIIEEAVEAANENVKLNNLNNCEFIAGDVLTKVDELKDKPDIIIIDPPRSGVNHKALRKIINFNAPHIVYVSCKPTSLAEDLQVLKEHGYEVKKVKCMDMFPHTPHVETVCLIEKKSL